MLHSLFFLGCCLLHATRAQFTLLSPDAFSNGEGIPIGGQSSTYGPEDKLVRCNSAMVYIDLNPEWIGPLCDPAVGCGATEADCVRGCARGDKSPATRTHTHTHTRPPSPSGAQPLLKRYRGNRSLTVEDCQGHCMAMRNCTAVNYAPIGPLQGDCVLRGCNDLPPAIDPNGDNYTVYSYHRGTTTTIALDGSYTRAPLYDKPCPTTPAPLTPRQNGYSVGAVRVSSSGLDRLLIMGGDAAENHVYYSDDCGSTWTCCEFPSLRGAVALPALPPSPHPPPLTPPPR
jgi:hypothetical protein